MARPKKMSSEDIQTQLSGLHGWALINDKLRRELKFKTFVQAFGFMTQVAILAEKRDHHPEWSNVYSRVVIDLTTHDAGGITEHDFALAKGIDEVLADMGHAE